MGEYVHEPWLADSLSPTRTRPEMCGALPAAGTSITLPVAVDAAGGDAPFTLVARTVERTTWPPSAVVSWYVVAVAPEISTQLFPAEEQRCHW